MKRVQKHILKKQECNNKESLIIHDTQTLLNVYFFLSYHQNKQMKIAIFIKPIRLQN
ncbi:hypothetical protein HanIR_Chr01g0045651 [Helianthus annuus]|nr:hypothetical protein HanIR_Chr01g0045651 [Helianthus annuus]